MFDPILLLNKDTIFFQKHTVIHFVIVKYSECRKRLRYKA